MSIAEERWFFKYVFRFIKIHIFIASWNQTCIQMSTSRTSKGLADLEIVVKILRGYCQ